MQQYFGCKKENNTLYLNEMDLNHIKNVMRMKENDEVIVSYENKSYIINLNKDLLSGKIKELYKEENNANKIIAFIPVLQEEKMDLIIQKGTELGISEFIPIEFERCKFKLKNEAKNKKLIRWNTIAKEASEQSHRVIQSVVKPIINVNNIDTVKGVNILCSLDKNNVKDIAQVLTIKNVYDTISLVFGPEGGISNNEEILLESKGFQKTSLGKNVLRSETVIMMVCSIIIYLRR